MSVFASIHDVQVNDNAPFLKAEGRYEAQVTAAKQGVSTKNKALPVPYIKVEFTIKKIVSGGAGVVVDDRGAIVSTATSDYFLRDVKRLVAVLASVKIQEVDNELSEGIFPQDDSSPAVGLTVLVECKPVTTKAGHVIMKTEIVRVIE